MANELKHGSVGTELTQTEWEGIGTHVLESQAAGDIVYASSSSQLRRLAKGTDTHVLILSSGVPAWSATTGITTVGTIATGVWQGTDVGVAYGGTGVSTLTANGVLVGNGASAIGSIDMSTKGHVLIGDGSGNPQMLGVGTNTHVLTADSGETTGVKWAAPAAAAAGSLTGSTLASGVTASSLTSVGTVTSGIWNAGAVTSSGNFTTSNAAGPQILNEAATSTNPTLTPNRAEPDTGIGWASADKLSFIVGGSETLRIDSWLNFYGDRFQMSANTAGSQLLHIENTNTVSGSNSQINLAVETIDSASSPAYGTGDPKITFGVEGIAGAAYALGVDASTSTTVPNFVISSSATLGTDNILTLEGDGDAVLAGTLTENSDERIKTNVQTIPSALSKVSQMRGVSFDRLDGGGSGVGLIAQELESIAPVLVKTSQNSKNLYSRDEAGNTLLTTDEDGESIRIVDTEITNVKSVAYGNLAAYLIEAIKELKVDIDILKAR